MVMEVDADGNVLFTNGDISDLRGSDKRRGRNLRVFGCRSRMAQLPSLLRWLICIIICSALCTVKWHKFQRAPLQRSVILFPDRQSRS